MNVDDHGAERMIIMGGIKAGMTETTGIIGVQR
jgi:hypothetical protein